MNGAAMRKKQFESGGAKEKTPQLRIVRGRLVATAFKNGVSDCERQEDIALQRVQGGVLRRL